MKKSEVIYGGGTTKVPVNRVNWDAVLESIENHLGPNARVRTLAQAKKAVGEAKAAKNAAKTYVKVGLVKNNLVLRIKTPGLLIDDEKDTLLIPNARRMLKAFAAQREQQKQQKAQADEAERNAPLEAQAAKHLQLRQRMVKAQEDFLADVRKARREIDKRVRMAEKFHARATSARGGLDERMQAASGTIRAVEEAEEILDGLRKSYKAFTRQGGELMQARQDFNKISQLPEDQQEPYREASNKAFRDGDAFMKKSNAEIDEARDTVRELRTLRDEAEAASGLGKEAGVVLGRLDEIRNDLEKLESGISRRHGKSEAYADETMSPWPIIFAGTAPPQALRKALDQKRKEADELFKGLPAGQKRLQQVERQIRAIPRGALEVNEVAKEVAAIRSALQAASSQLDEIASREKAYRALVKRAEETLKGLGA